MSDVHAERAPRALMDPTDPWSMLSAHVVATKGARGARVGGARVTGRIVPVIFPEVRRNLRAGRRPTVESTSSPWATPQLLKRVLAL